MSSNISYTREDEILPSFNDYYIRTKSNTSAELCKKTCTCSNICNSITNIVSVSILGINMYMAYSMHKFFFTMYGVLEIVESIVPPPT